MHKIIHYGKRRDFLDFKLIMNQRLIVKSLNLLNKFLTNFYTIYLKSFKN